MVTITISTPPSTNGLYANLPGKGRVKTKAYKDWKAEAVWTIAAQRPARIVGDFQVEMRVQMRGDADNRAKAAIDVLKGIVTDDDARCMRLTITKEPGRKDCLLVVSPYTGGLA